MPIDRELDVANYEEALQKMLRDRKAGIGTEIDDTRSWIGGLRDEAMGSTLQGQLQGVAGAYNLNPSVVGAGMEQAESNKLVLGDTLEETLSRRRQGMGRERVNLAYNMALESALDAGKVRTTAEAYARKFAADEIRRENEGEMRAKRREQLIRQQEVANRYAKEGVVLENQSANDAASAEYQAAMARILNGVPAQLLSYYMYFKKPGTPGTYDNAVYGKSTYAAEQPTFQSNYMPQDTELNKLRYNDPQLGGV